MGAWSLRRDEAMPIVVAEEGVEGERRVGRSDGRRGRKPILAERFG